MERFAAGHRFLKLFAAIAIVQPIGASVATDIDKALEAASRPKPAASGVVLDKTFRDSKGHTQSQVAEILNKRADERAKFWREVGESGAVSQKSSTVPIQGDARSSTNSSGAGAKTFVCQYKCTNAKFLGADKTSLTIRVKASDRSAAEEETVRHAKASCYQQTQRVWDVGSQQCREE